jgi:signal transduction histidine kinase
MNFNFFSKNIEVQRSIKKSMMTGYLGNFIFPLAYILLTDIEEKIPTELTLFVIMTIFVSTFHFFLSFKFNALVSKFGERFWNSSYLISLSLEAFLYTPPLLFLLYEYGAWSPEFLLGMIIWGIAVESFSRFTSVFLEAYLLSVLFLFLPLFVNLPFYGVNGLTLTFLLAIYLFYNSYSTIVAFREFTKLLKAQEASQSAVAKVQNFMDVVPAMIVQFDDNLEISMVNSQFQNLVSKSSVLLKDHLSRNLLSNIQNFVQSGASSMSFEIKSKIGHLQAWFQVILSSVRSNETTMVLIDISEKKKNEIDLEQQRSMAVNAARLASLGEMAGGIAHEINNPLTIISGHNDRIRKNITSDDIKIDKILKSIDKIDETVERITNTVQGMRALSRNMDDEETQSYKVEAILKDVLNLSLEKYKAVGVDVDVQYQEKNLEVNCHFEKIGQILINLLNNAFDAIENQEIKKIVH